MPNRSQARGWRWIVSGLAVAALAALLTGSVVAAAAAAPTNTKEPSITGSPSVGKDLTGDDGTWTGTGNSYARKWLRCDTNAANCVAISGATGNKYRVTPADLGTRIRFEVRASNAEGSMAAVSNNTALITSAAGDPASTSPPGIVGSATVGTTLTATVGAWVGDQPITYTYQWTRCDKNGDSCKNIGKETKSTYKLTQAEVGFTIRIKVTARNSRGRATAFSVQTALVTDASGGGGGVINLPGGGKSIDVKDVPRGERLIVQTVTFSPNPVRSRSNPITVTITVKDTRGYFVRDALVFIRSTPLLTSTPTDAQTAVDGRISYAIMPHSDFPLRNGYNVQFFVKAYRKGDPSLAGISGTRLVQVATAK